MSHELSFRPPRDNEWPICRMLLPETFADVATRSYLLCSVDGAPTVAGAASFRRSPEAITHLRLHIVPPYRRRGVGSQIIEHLAGRGAPLLAGTSEITRESGSEAFCERNGFHRIDALTTVEADMDELREYTRRLSDRLRLPQGARTIPLRDAPRDQVAWLHAQHVAHSGELNHWRGLVAHTPEMDISPVVIMDGEVAGILLGTVEGTTAVVRTRVVAPGFQGTWVNAVLLAQALDTGWNAGARRARFSFTESNRDTRKLAARCHAQVVSVLAQFERRLKE